MGGLVARLSRRVGAGFHGSGQGGAVGTGSCLSSWVRQGCEPLQGLGDHVGPRPVGREAEDAAPSSGDELGGGGEQSEP